MRTGLTLEEAKEALCAGVTPSGPEVLPLAEALELLKIYGSETL